MGLSPSSMRRHLFCYQAGIVALIVMVLPSSMHRCLHSPGIFAIVTITDIVVLIAIASLLLSSWCCCPSHNGIVAIIDAQVYLPLSQWHCCPHCAGAIAQIIRVLLPLLCQHCHLIDYLPSQCMGIVTVIAPVLLSLLSWRLCAIVPFLSPLSCWCCHPWCTGVGALLAQASLRLLCLNCAAVS